MRPSEFLRDAALVRRICEKVFSSPVSFAGTGYEYPPMFLWGEMEERSLRTGWKAFAASSRWYDPGIYVHIPFCASKCGFCEFLSFVPSAGEVDEYLLLLEKEAASHSRYLGRIPWRTVYIGGGTPSFLSVRQLRTLFDRVLRGNFDLGSCVQIAFEAHPASLTREKAAVLKKCGVNRLTIGVQSLDAKVLARCGRRQGEEDFERAIRNARDCGIPHINADVMAGIPGQSVRSFSRTMRRVCEARPSLVHVNPFHPSVPTRFPCGSKGPEPRFLQRRDRMVSLAQEMLCAHGLTSREYAVPFSSSPARNVQLTDQVQHNSAYLGIGLNACSHIPFHSRYLNEVTMREYAAAVMKGRIPVRCGRRISKQDEMIFYVSANLRYAGVALREFRRLFGKVPQEVFGEELAFLAARGKVSLQGEYILPGSMNTETRELGSLPDYYFYSKIFFGSRVLRECARALDVVA